MAMRHRLVLAIPIDGHSRGKANYFIALLSACSPCDVSRRMKPFPLWLTAFGGYFRGACQSLARVLVRRSANHDSESAAPLSALSLS
jgi:hypothetical protein